jgi:hypothetical protein
MLFHVVKQLTVWCFSYCNPTYESAQRLSFQHCFDIKRIDTGTCIMVTGLEETLGLVTVAFSLFEVTSSAQETAPTTSALLEKFVLDAKARRILEPPILGPTADDPPYRSPVARAILDIYLKPLPRRAYVLYAEASTGKSAAARHIMKTMLATYRNNAPRGIMISGLPPKENYVSHMSSLLGATDSKGWANALIMALVPDPRSPARKHSILILDEFNSAGPDDINITFVKMLYRAITDKSIYLLIMTQNKKLANHLADVNNRSKITALPSAVNNPEAPLGIEFDWKSMNWDTALLTKYLEKLDHGKNSQLLQQKNDKGELRWLDGPMTPHKARWTYEALTATDVEDEAVKEEIYAAYGEE